MLIFQFFQIYSGLLSESTRSVRQWGLVNTHGLLIWKVLWRLFGTPVPFTARTPQLSSGPVVCKYQTTSLEKLRPCHWGWCFSVPWSPGQRRLKQFITGIMSDTLIIVILYWSTLWQSRFFIWQLTCSCYIQAVLWSYFLRSFCINGRILLVF